ncbi:tetratricopeptide repeat protein [Streptomyces sp. NPDC001568]|uniref:tetratricopeptide repeat protein n=1 Tax=Streptomyces sp. NPDC001568 TaxID=3364588 RepID=UPI0036C2D2B6
MIRVTGLGQLPRFVRILRRSWSRINLAITYCNLERHQEALALEESVLADRERLLGTDHPDAITARANLAITHRNLERHHDADHPRSKEPQSAGVHPISPDGVELGPGRNRSCPLRVPVGMSDESVITIEIRGHETAAVEAAHRISVQRSVPGAAYARRGRSTGPRPRGRRQRRWRGRLPRP